MPRPSQKDLARRLGVSKATVSLALSKHPRIPEGTRARVLALAEKLGYRPDHALAAIARQRWKKAGRNKGFVFAWLHDHPERLPMSAAARLEGAKRQAELVGARIEVIRIKKQSDLRTACQMLWHRGIQALVFDRIYHLLDTAGMEWEKFSVVACDSGALDLPVDTVRIDTVRGTRRAIEELKKAGCERIGLAYLHGLRDSEYERSFRAEYALYQFSLEKTSQRIPVLSCEYKDAESLVAWYRKHRPDGVISTNTTGYWRLREAGVKFPGDAMFASLMDTRDEKTPVVAGLDYRYDLVGAMAIRHLDAIWRDNQRGLPDAPVQLLIEPLWTPGESLVARTISQK